MTFEPARQNAVPEHFRRKVVLASVVPVRGIQNALSEPPSDQ